MIQRFKVSKLFKDYEILKFEIDACPCSLFQKDFGVSLFRNMLKVTFFVSFIKLIFLKNFKI